MAKKIRYNCEWGFLGGPEQKTVKVPVDILKDLIGSDRLDYFIKRVRSKAELLEDGQFLSIVEIKTHKYVKTFLKKSGAVKEIEGELNFIPT